MLKTTCLLMLLASLGASAADPDRKVHLKYGPGVSIFPRGGAKTAGPGDLEAVITESRWPQGYRDTYTFEWKVGEEVKQFTCALTKTPDDGTPLKEDHLIFVVQAAEPNVPMDKNGPLSFKCEQNKP